LETGQMNKLARLDHRYIWHPFTQMRDWLKREPIVMVEGKGTVLKDAKGREYLDANSSIWTNLHGHNHPKINAAIQRQLKKVAHTSALGLANEPASLLAEKLIRAANSSGVAQASSLRVGAASLPLGHEAGMLREPAGWKAALRKVFFSDDGSTAMEVALKLAYEYARRTRGIQRPKFLSLDRAYHGDTIGAVSLGHIDPFHKAYRGLLFKTDKVMAPYCYRCPFNRARPERADAREYRKCDWECTGKLEQKFAAQKKRGNSYSAFVFEPLIQGAAGMIVQPKGWLRRAADIARGYGAQLIADEVMTGFGRMGSSDSPAHPPTHPPSLFACHAEGLQPDFLALAKGLTGGYLPMAATLTTQPVFDAFLGEYDELKTFFHGHSYTGNQLGAAAALASLEILQSPASERSRLLLEHTLRKELQTLWALPNVGDSRRVGLIAGVELVKDWRTRAPIPLRERAGIRVCEAMAKRGVLTRSIGNEIVLMPPYCTTAEQMRTIVSALRDAITKSL
jgi:adenosylmethionine-8-amino-7-oxononanoate aminotransferase